ncbi:MAG: OsmC family protein [Acidobacteria bacterium]|nr:OsmC family protein [Acidobacteriota bacterium]
MNDEHHYMIHLQWTGNQGSGTSGYRTYSRDHVITGVGKPPLLGSSDPVFRGDAARYNPEELLVASLAACHMLWMLHLCADAAIVVIEYTDSAGGVMEVNPDGSGQFTSVVLRPRVMITDSSRMDEVRALHQKAHGLCFIARSVNFPVRHEPETISPPPSRP